MDLLSEAGKVPLRARLRRRAYGATGFSQRAS